MEYTGVPAVDLRQIGSDIARALAVLALVFLSFAHAPAAVAGPHGEVLAGAMDMSLCGHIPNGDGKAHPPCHACRLGAGADLPPPTGLPLTQRRQLAGVGYGALPVVAAPAAPFGPATARGPPAA